MMFRRGREDLLCFIIRHSKAYLVKNNSRCSIKSIHKKTQKLRAEQIKLESLVGKLEEKSKKLNEQAKQMANACCIK